MYIGYIICNNNVNKYSNLLLFRQNILAKIWLLAKWAQAGMRYANRYNQLYLTLLH